MDVFWLIFYHLFDHFVVKLFVCGVSDPAVPGTVAEWPAGQLYPAPPQGCSCDGSTAKILPNLTKMNNNLPSLAKPSSAPRIFLPCRLHVGSMAPCWPLGSHFRSSWPDIAHFYHMLLLVGRILAPHSPNMAHHSPNMAPTESQLSRKLVSRWVL